MLNFDRAGALRDGADPVQLSSRNHRLTAHVCLEPGAQQDAAEVAVKRFSYDRSGLSFEELNQAADYPALLGAFIPAVWEWANFHRGRAGDPSDQELICWSKGLKNCGPVPPALARGFRSFAVRLVLAGRADGYWCVGVTERRASDARNNYRAANEDEEQDRKGWHLVVHACRK